ncbi:CGNR zinc finger domain-containing protein [Actinomadura rudentiformis]|uniref:CGNR zinc finger domain-containing protein n=1 Tax=Actinomadura rudentiformis TaxID=359158 RepID=A0A6H9YSM5_9ACTN|nr:CGNR zinc finger domain-containing protein [Actinomadura rudentiformis]KAB2343328.1 CGNR zinc finger domain-containing protein [Actinomadura rudentiformis]
MDLASYADLAIELVNTQDSQADNLRDLDALRELLVIRPHLGGRVSHRDLDAMRELRAQLRAVFVSAVAGDEEDAIDRLNSLLMHHPVHPQLSGHDGLRWHLHLNEGGSIQDRYAAWAAMGLAVKVSDRGLDRLRICRADGCERVFFDSTANMSQRYCSERCAGRPSVAAAHHPSRTSARAAIDTTVPAQRRSSQPDGRKTEARDGGQ